MSCPLCRCPRAETLWLVRDRIFRTTNATFELRRCEACEIVFLWPQPTASELRGFYPEGYWSEHARDGGPRQRLTELYRRAVLRDHLRFVGRVVAEQERRGMAVRLLDVGAGDGCFLEALACTHRVGMDLSRTATRAVRARRLPAVRGSLSPPPFAEGSFTLITMFHFLEHVASPERQLAAARALLSIDGELVVQVPNARSWQAGLLGGRWAGYEVPRHLVNYSDRTLRRALEQSGFEVVAETTFSLRDNSNTLINSLLPGLFPPGRAARGVGHRGVSGWLGDSLYLALTALTLPFTVLESVFGRGAAVMVRARPARDA